MDRARAVFRDAVDEPLAVDQQAFGAAELERAFAVLQPLDAARLVGPGARSVNVGRPEQIAAAAARAFDRIGPKRDHYRAIGFAHAAPARARILDPNAARFEGARARHQVPRLRGAAAFARGRRTLASLRQRLAAERDHAALVQALGILAQLLDVLDAELRDALGCPVVGALAAKGRIASYFHAWSSAPAARGRRRTAPTLRPHRAQYSPPLFTTRSESIPSPSSDAWSV